MTEHPSMLINTRSSTLFKMEFNRFRASEKEVNTLQNSFQFVYTNYKATPLLRPRIHILLEFWHIPPIFVQIRLECLVILFDRKLQLAIFFSIFNELMFTQYANVARFARNVELDFLAHFEVFWYAKY